MIGGMSRTACLAVATANEYALLKAPSTEFGPLEWLAATRDDIPFIREWDVDQYYVPRRRETDNIVWKDLLFNPSCRCPSRDGSWLQSLILYAPETQFDAVFPRPPTKNSKEFIGAFISYQIELVCKKQYNPGLESVVISKLQTLVSSYGMKTLRDHALLVSKRDTGSAVVRAISHAGMLFAGTRMRAFSLMPPSPYVRSLAIAPAVLAPLNQVFRQGAWPQVTEPYPLSLCHVF